MGNNFSVCNRTIVTALGYGEPCGNSCSFANVEIEPGKTYLFQIVSLIVFIWLTSDRRFDRQLYRIQYRWT